jgi:hypothetical protein
MPRPLRKLLNSLELPLNRAETFRAQHIKVVSQERLKYSKPSRGVKNNFQLADNPADTLLYCRQTGR